MVITTRQKHQLSDLLLRLPLDCQNIENVTTLKVKREKQRQLPVLRALYPEQRSAKNSVNCLSFERYEQRSARNSTNCLSFERYVLNNAPLETVPIACFSSVML